MYSLVIGKCQKSWGVLTHQWPTENQEPATFQEVKFKIFKLLVCWIRDFGSSVGHIGQRHIEAPLYLVQRNVCMLIHHRQSALQDPLRTIRSITPPFWIIWFFEDGILCRMNRIFGTPLFLTQHEYESRWDEPRDINEDHVEIFPTSLEGIFWQLILYILASLFHTLVNA